MNVTEPTARILIVDDHDDSRHLMGRVLARMGYSIDAADCVAGALALYAEGKYDLIVSDIGLPDGTGHDLLRQLLNPPPSIATSGFAQSEDVNRSTEAGFARHLTKPLDMGHFCDEVERLIADGGRGRILSTATVATMSLAEEIR